MDDDYFRSMVGKLEIKINESGKDFESGNKAMFSYDSFIRIIEFFRLRIPTS